MSSELLTNLDKLHTTILGVERIRNNLSIDIPEVILWCRLKIESSNNIIRKGKNWYVFVDDIMITINAHSFTIITAHIVMR